MTEENEERARIRKRARELAEKGLSLDQVCERVRAMCVFCVAPDRYTVSRWMKHDEEPKEPKKPRRHSGGSPKRPIAASDGRVFESVTQAAASLGVSKTAMFKALRNGWKCRGLEIRYKED